MGCGRYRGPVPVSARPIRIGARRSPLARAQADLVSSLLAAAGVPSEFVGITTVGDVDGRALTEIGGTGVFTSAVRDALIRGQIDVAVHSLKDLPTAAIDGLLVAAVPAREDTRDVLVGRRLGDLTDGVRIGTGAPRRAVQLIELGRRLGIVIEPMPIRGNVDTRIAAVTRGECDGVLLAAAGLRRLGHISDTLEGSSNPDTVVKGQPATVLDEELLLPAPGQGALALEIHEGLDQPRANTLRLLDHPVSRAESLAERGFLATLEAGCTAPVGARAVVKSVRGMSLDLTLTAVIGRTYLSNLSEPTNSGPTPTQGLFRVQRRGATEDPTQFGAAAAREALARLHEQVPNGHEQRADRATAPNTERENHL
jgi:hydroxymethylbilane synthase